MNGHGGRVSEDVADEAGAIVNQTNGLDWVWTVLGVCGLDVLDARRKW